MRNEKLAKLAEHSTFTTTIDMGGNGTLPSTCTCGGKLDFSRVNNADNQQTVLKCRACGEIIKLD